MAFYEFESARWQAIARQRYAMARNAISRESAAFWQKEAAAAQAFALAYLWHAIEWRSYLERAA